MIYLVEIWSSNASFQGGKRYSACVPKFSIWNILFLLENNALWIKIIGDRWKLFVFFKLIGIGHVRACQHTRILKKYGKKKIGLHQSTYSQEPSWVHKGVGENDVSWQKELRKSLRNSRLVCSRFMKSGPENAMILLTANYCIFRESEIWEGGKEIKNILPR